MNFNYMKEMLLSDLLCLYYTTHENKYLNEIKNRMLFCGYTNDEIYEFIRFESEILNSKEEKYSKKIIDRHYIIGKNKNKYIFQNPEIYMYNSNGDNKKTLLISETIAIIDEAIFLSYSKLLNTYNASKEIIYLAQENENNWLYFEFMNRLEYICRCANRVFDGPKKASYSEKSIRLYDNEMQICLYRWNVDVSSRKFIPYTEEYYLIS